MRNWFFLAVFLLMALVGTVSAVVVRDPAAAPGGSCPVAPGPDVSSVEVVRVVDGDTFQISPSVMGMDTVRMVGVDTPETVDPDGPVENGGPEASHYTKGRLLGARVKLQPAEDSEDSYGRLLAYVWTDKGLYQEELVSGGYASVLTIPPNDKYASCLERSV